ncbi:hypothetical protein E2C01_055862 [Portunus trituberculatus]|uniref:Uncharacterized protein n=1 Tax=Portunus trituberculatus TaxID=210409 RepID=A0A5B7GVV9_PORTR|nr:hypothetical protein [Portunus trituberculatus]
MVARALSSEVAARLYSVLATPPQADNYTTVKSAIMGALVRPVSPHWIWLGTTAAAPRRSL